MEISPLEFVKYHAIGNDYLFLDATKFPLPSLEGIKKICHRNFGIGSDGLLYGGPSADGNFFLKIFNPDGGLAEISGNGTRIFAYAMFEHGYVATNTAFTVKTFKKSVNAKVISKKFIEVDMGIPSFADDNIPSFEKNCAKITINGRGYTYYPVSMGNPHCVIFVDKIGIEEVKAVGPFLENNPLFPQKTNVQFAKVIDKRNISIEIWERGAGYTLASGSSACAVFSVAKNLDLCNDEINVQMPGGILSLRAETSGNIIQSGPVEKICNCFVQRQFLDN